MLWLFSWLIHLCSDFAIEASPKLDMKTLVFIKLLTSLYLSCFLKYVDSELKFGFLRNELIFHFFFF